MSQIFEQNDSGTETSANESRMLLHEETKCDSTSCEISNDGNKKCCLEISVVDNSRSNGNPALTSNSSCELVRECTSDLVTPKPQLESVEITNIKVEENKSKKDRKNWLYQTLFERQKREFSGFNLFLGLVSIGMYIFDVGSDLLNAYSYYRNPNNLENNMIYFGLTLFFTAAPSLMMQIYSVVKESKSLRKHKRRNTRKNNLHFHAFIVAHVLQVGIIYRIVRMIYFGRKDKEGEKNKYYHKKWINEEKRITAMRLFETYFEAIPQLTLQIYIMLTTGHASAITVLACFGSVGGLSMSLRSFDVFVDVKAEEPEDLSKAETLFYMLYQSFTILSRVLIYSLLLDLGFAACFLGLLVHAALLSMAGKCCIGDPRSYKGIKMKEMHAPKEEQEVIAEMTIGVVLKFSFPFFGLRGREDLRELNENILGCLAALQAVYFLENCVIATIWFGNRPGAANSCAGNSTKVPPLSGTTTESQNVGFTQLMPTFSNNTTDLPFECGVPSNIATVIAIMVPIFFILGIICGFVLNVMRKRNEKALAAKMVAVEKCCQCDCELSNVNKSTYFSQKT